MSDGQKGLQDQKQGENEYGTIGIICLAANKSIYANTKNADEKDEQGNAF